ncbi:DUF4893 domain-containing protein [Sphingomonas koreensis]|nr:DUF4893 domain-containing protein [Sphingomonas koreensis]
MTHTKLFALALLGALGGCAAAKGPLATEEGAASPTWRAIATEDDQARLRGWRDAWMTATEAVRKAGEKAPLDQDATLFDPDRALPTPLPPVGDYRCRWIKLGSASAAVEAYTAYPAAPCRVKMVGKVLRLTVLDGPQRPRGLIFDDETARGVFLGTLMLGDETRPLDYGRDTKRDMAGYVERIGDARWRLVLPQPHFESLLDVIELVPAA